MRKIRFIIEFGKTVVEIESVHWWSSACYTFQHIRLLACTFAQPYQRGVRGTWTAHCNVEGTLPGGLMAVNKLLLLLLF